MIRFQSPKCYSFVKGWLSVLMAFTILSTNLVAWTDGSLLIWMDNDRGHALEPLAKKFEKDFGIQVTIEAPEKLTESFPLAAQAGKGPDLVVWAHDKLGEWADSGLISPVQISDEFEKKFFPKAWQAVRHQGQIWAYPVGLEAATLIYNKKLLDGAPPTKLADLLSTNNKIKQAGVTTILWDYTSPFYSWGILASGGAYVFGNTGTDYNWKNVGVATPGAVAGLSTITALVRAGVLPKSVSYSDTEELMAKGRLAMMISGPWAWSNLIKSGIDFGVAVIPGVNGNVGRPFVGVTVAYLNRSSPNLDLATEFLENRALTEEGLTAMDHAKPIGLPALVSLYEKMARENPNLRQLKVAVDAGQVMPNIPQMGRFFTALGTALQIATEGHASPESALREAAATMLSQSP